MGNTDTLPRLKPVGFCFFLGFPSSLLTIGAGCCRTILSSFSVSIARGVASLGVSVLPLHTSLSACNRDTPQPIPTWTRNGGVPNFPASVAGKAFTNESILLASPDGEDLITGLFTVPLMRTPLFKFAIHPSPKGRGLSGSFSFVGQENSLSI
jgi:hypothetical protein